MYPVKVKALRVEQPLGVYYVAIIPAHVLMDVTFSDRMRASIDDDDGYDVDGTQRGKKGGRPVEIAEYIDRDDSAFPNSIILAANFAQDTGLISTEDPDDDGESAVAWQVVELADGCLELTIPTNAKLAAIIDGQHRLDGFQHVRKPDRLNTEMICSVFMDLPKPYQAQLFATINSTQKQVDKSLTYELFGYNISDEPPERWTPDKLAVFLTRRLNTREESPLMGHILVAPKRDRALLALNESQVWHISTATIVEGIMRLFSANPRRDTSTMLSSASKLRKVLEASRDKTPLRRLYIEGNDALLYAIVLNYLKVCDRLLWKPAKPGSFIIKTVGVQALFDILRHDAPNFMREGDASEAYFETLLRPAAAIDFSAVEFQNASGSGRSMIRRSLQQAIDSGR
ncbi:DNA phosphorothioation-associated DGQHR protein 1 [Caulobacter sp. AP07]|uniref:DNA phosphorothioation-associated DGQHR protein 1 n=1 Tax=Caulobacter sp. AP07 TaxID=1144304 RepID=UPI000271ED57|nr:DNA phosphorothioation-associated DGQHR protein 1 [Caulobacter sp. AP07]EJL37557.1 DNA phosphorothioation-associated DGQHR protein 1 [Caulobacter sp. AP07]